MNWKDLPITWTAVTPDYLDNYFRVEENEQGPMLIGVDQDQGSSDGTLIRVPIKFITEFGFNKEYDPEHGALFVRVQWRDEKPGNIATYYLSDFIII